MRRIPSLRTPAALPAAAGERTARGASVFAPAAAGTGAASRAAVLPRSGSRSAAAAVRPPAAAALRSAPAACTAVRAAGQPYGQPGQAPYGQPAYAQPGQQPYGAPQYGAQPAYPAPVYGAPGPGGPFDGATDPEDLTRPLYGATFGQAIKRFFKQYADFNGRASRSEYWWVSLFVFLVQLVPIILLMVGLIGMGISTSSYSYDPYSYGYGSAAPAVGAIILLVIGAILTGLVSLALLIPSFAVGWRRFHDANFAGPLYLLSSPRPSPTSAGSAASWCWCSRSCRRRSRGVATTRPAPDRLRRTALRGTGPSQRSCGGPSVSRGAGPVWVRGRCLTRCAPDESRHAAQSDACRMPASRYRRSSRVDSLPLRRPSGTGTPADLSTTSGSASRTRRNVRTCASMSRTSPSRISRSETRSPPTRTHSHETVRDRPHCTSSTHGPVLSRRSRTVSTAP
ncbi:DUF805 domain-containing protein [Leucobacter soli]|uniref:DUF805 domain-containing protein n=1 Tax=Leucobacter soli TaxID=2812850 RepID=UPI0036144E0A